MSETDTLKIFGSLDGSPSSCSALGSGVNVHLRCSSGSLNMPPLCFSYDSRDS